MATAVFHLRAKPVPEVIERTREIINRLNQNGAEYPAPVPSTATITALVDRLELLYQDAIHGGTDRKSLVRMTKKLLLQKMGNLRGYVQSESRGDAEKILLVASTKGKGVPAGILPAPANVRSKYGFREGEILLLWRAVRNRKLYRVQINRIPGDDTAWEDMEKGITGKVRLFVPGLISGEWYGFRVATVSAPGTGAWSDATWHKTM